MTNFLASIKDTKEAKIVSSANIDIVDLKDINDGALGFVGIDFISKACKILSKYTLSVTMGNDSNPNNFKNIENIEFVVDKNIDFVKIDVEHFELQVCKGAENTFKKYMPTIMFENKRNEANDCKQYLKTLGYTTKEYKSETVAYISNR